MTKQTNKRLTHQAPAAKIAYEELPPSRGSIINAFLVGDEWRPQQGEGDSGRRAVRIIATVLSALYATWMCILLLSALNQLAPSGWIALYLADILGSFGAFACGCVMACICSCCKSSSTSLAKVQLICIGICILGRTWKDDQRCCMVRSAPLQS